MTSATRSCPETFFLSFSNVGVPWTLVLNYCPLTQSPSEPHHSFSEDSCLHVVTSGSSPVYALAHSADTTNSTCPELPSSSPDLSSCFLDLLWHYPFLTSPQSENLSQSLPFLPSAPAFLSASFLQRALLLVLPIFLSFLKNPFGELVRGSVSKGAYYTSLVIWVWCSEPT